MVTDSDLPSHRPSVARGITACVFGALCIAYAILSVYGTWNPRHYVVLLKYFNNPVGGITIVLILALIAIWCGFPIRSSASDRRRSLVRTTMIILILVSAFGLIFTYAFGTWRYQVSTLGRPASDGRLLATVNDFHGTEIHVLVGTGLGQRDVGSLGSACGLPSEMNAEWVNDDEVTVTTAYNTYHVQLDPTTGVPLVHFGATCSS
jgi:succinate dehydrogenase hydrophobic anchor subunit